MPPRTGTRLTEIYLVARGTSTLCVEQATPVLAAGDMIVIEPGKAPPS